MRAAKQTKDSSAPQSSVPRLPNDLGIKAAIVQWSPTRIYILTCYKSAHAAVSDSRSACDDEASDLDKAVLFWRPVSHPHSYYGFPHALQCLSAALLQPGLCFQDEDVAWTADRT